MTNFITLIETDIEIGWHWVEQKAIDLYNATAPIWNNVWATIKAFTIQDLWSAAAAFIAKLMAAGPIISGRALLIDLETAFLNAIQTLKTGWIPELTALGSNLLQTLLGLIHAQAVATAA